MYRPFFYLCIESIHTTMAEKKKPSNKSEKKPTAKKAPAPKSVDWAEVSDPCIVISLTDKHMKKGAEYPVSKEMAQVLVKHGKAKLK